MSGKEGEKKAKLFFSGRNGEISPFSNLVKTDSCGHFAAWVARQKAAPCELADAKKERERERKKNSTLKRAPGCPTQFIHSAVLPSHTGLV